jgi:hypothetical protein
MLRLPSTWKHPMANRCRGDAFTLVLRGSCTKTSNRLGLSAPSGSLPNDLVTGYVLEVQLRLSGRVAKDGF